MNYSQSILKLSLLLLLLSPLTIAGCDQSAGGSVSGTVTLNGEPLPNASIVFTPQEGGGRASVATTGEKGNYTLMQTKELSGAVLGSHKVVITTSVAESDEQGAPMTPELLPAKYNKKSELTATVEPGKNTINFELTTD